MKKLLLFFLVPFVFSCTTLQQDVNIEQISYNEEILSFEQRFSLIDANSLIPSVDDNEDLQKEQKIDDFIFDIEKSISEPSIQKAARARLLALEGKALLINGKKSKAKKAYEDSVLEYKGDSQALILASRLQLSKDFNLEDKMSEVSEKSLILLESAINLYKSKKFVDSVAKFDESFLSLNPFYRESYGKIRDLAWNMRNVDSDSEVANLMPLNEITVSQMLTIAKTKSEYLYNLAGGKKMNARAFYYKISSLGLLNPASKPLDSKNALGENDIVTKYVSARFLWNLYNSKRNSQNSLTKYSSKMKKSPIQDVDIDNPDFDAVLGCVENEFMSLKNGQKFDGNDNFTAIEFDSAIDIIK